MEQQYIRRDQHEVMRIGQTQVVLDSVIAAFQQGHSPETIRQQYPALTLEEVYGAITYYLSHPAEVEAYLRQQEAVWSHWQSMSRQRQNPVVDRLRAARQVDASSATEEWINHVVFLPL